METASEDEASKSHGFLQLSVANLQKKGSSTSEAESECALEERDLAPKAAQVCHSHSSSINSSGAPSIASNSDNHSSSAVMGQGGNSIDIYNFGCKYGTSFGTASMLGLQICLGSPLGQIAGQVLG